MRSGFVAFFVAALVATLLTPVMRALAKQLGVVDHPGEARKIHQEPIPRLGGLAIVFGTAAPLVGLYFYRNGLSNLIYSDARRVECFLLAALLVIATGVVDDIRGVPQRYRLVLEAIAGSIVYWGGWRIDGLALPWVGHLSLGVLALPATVLWVVAVINALNFNDGLDGLAAGTAVIASGTMFVLALHYHNPVAGVFSAAIAGSAFGFLLFNFHPATVYMGDTGSMFLGLSLAVASIGSSQKNATVVALLGPTLALGLPIGDTVLRVMRRVILRKPWFPADRKHVHHRLLDLGLSHRNATLVLYAAGLAFAVAALAIALGNRWMALGVSFFVAGCVIFAVRHLGFAEFNRFAEIRRRQSADATEEFMSHLEERVRALSGCRSIMELWNQTLVLAEEMDLDGLTWNVTTRITSGGVRPLRWERDASSTAQRAGPGLVWTPQERADFAVCLPLDAGHPPLGSLELGRDPAKRLPFTASERVALRVWVAALAVAVLEVETRVDDRAV
jgi:UDP-GlcNAc:undecaprenyl-phosphate GlcNAc-1-phosphate transferase